jgi:hypothetical protein
VIKGWEGNNGELIGAGEENDDGWYVNKYFGSRYEAAAIVELCEKLPSFKSLVKRKTDEQFFIVDTNKSDDRALLRNLYNNYLYPNQSMTTSDKSRAIGICLKAIRNNLFHGGKLYESGSDQSCSNMPCRCWKHWWLMGQSDTCILNLLKLNESQSSSLI